MKLPLSEDLAREIFASAREYLKEKSSRDEQRLPAMLLVTLFRMATIF